MTAAELLDKARDEVIHGVLRRYRLPEDRARALVDEEAARRTELLDAAAKAGGKLARLRKTAIYKDWVRAARQRAYYELRQYRPAEEALAPESVRGAVEAGDLTLLLEAHVSTRERLASLPEFRSQLLPLVRNARSVLDAGCGLVPLLWPWEDLPSLQQYHALDRDPVAVEALRSFADARGERRLFAREWSLGDGWGTTGEGEYDLALMLKLVPVVARQHRAQLPILQDVPARTLVLTGARQSMTKHRSIERREASILRRFVEEIPGRWRVTGELTTPDETGLILARN